MRCQTHIIHAAWLVLFILGAICKDASADVLIGTNGERFVGRILEETTDRVVFDSESGGRLVVPRSHIQDLQRGSSVGEISTNQVPTSVASSTAATNTAWQPPGVGKDGFDWIQLKSGEWLKGHLDYVQNKKVQFESDELEDLSLKFKDVRRIYSAKPMYAKFDNREQLYGSVIVSNDVVEVFGPEQVELSRDQLTGITPGGSREIEFWSGKANIGLNFQSGNTKEETL